MIGIPVGIKGWVIGLKICAIAAGIKYKSIIMKKKRKHDEMVLLAKSKLNIEVLIYKVLIDSVISHDEFVFINVLKNVMI